MLKKCFQCGGAVTTATKDYAYTESGLSNVILTGIRVGTCIACGEQYAEIPHIEELHEVLAVSLATSEAPLTAEKVKFLRSYMGWSNQEMAHMLGITDAHSSRLANGKYQLTPATDRLLRILVLLGPSDDSFATQKDSFRAKVMDLIAQHRAPQADEDDAISVTMRNDHWHPRSIAHAS